MSEHKVSLRWERGDAAFEYQKYPRNHTWKFDGGHEMTASAAPAYLGDPKNVDPEEAFVAAISSCHMLTFLAAACKKKFVLDEYTDDAVGHMEKNAEGKMAITKVRAASETKILGRQSADRQGSGRHAPFRARELFHRELGQDRSNGGEVVPRLCLGILSTDLRRFHRLG